MNRKRVDSNLPHTLTFRGLRGLSGAKRSASYARATLIPRKRQIITKVMNVYLPTGWEMEASGYYRKFSVTTRRSPGHSL